MSDEFIQNGTVGDVVTDSSVSEKSKGVAAVLCFFLGALGIHRFYVGKVGTGLLLLALWIVGGIITLLTLGLGGFVMIPAGIWVIVDFIMILCGNFKDKDGHSLK